MINVVLMLPGPPTTVTREDILAVFYPGSAWTPGDPVELPVYGYELYMEDQTQYDENGVETVAPVEARRRVQVGTKQVTPHSWVPTPTRKVNVALAGARHAVVQYYGTIEEFEADLDASGEPWIVGAARSRNKVPEVDQNGNPVYDTDPDGNQIPRYAVKSHRPDNPGLWTNYLRPVYDENGNQTGTVQATQFPTFQGAEPIVL